MTDVFLLFPIITLNDLTYHFSIRKYLVGTDFLAGRSLNNSIAWNASENRPTQKKKKKNIFFLGFSVLQSQLSQIALCWSVFLSTAAAAARRAPKDKHEALRTPSPTIERRVAYRVSSSAVVSLSCSQLELPPHMTWPDSEAARLAPCIPCKQHQKGE